MSDPTVVVTTENEVVIVSQGSVTIATPALPPLTVTENYSVLIADANRKSIRPDSVGTLQMQLPELTSANDGIQFAFLITGTGGVEILSPSGVSIGSIGDTVLRGTTRFGAVRVEYIHADLHFAVIEGSGSWRSDVI